MFDLTLTFDNGPDPDVTPHVLDTLTKHGIKTTFFVLGRKLEDRAIRRLAERAHDEGHWIGNHTYTHTVPLGEQTDPQTAEKEVGRTQRLIGELSHANRWFRPFASGGNLTDCMLKPSVVDHLVDGKYSLVLWNSIPRDWEDPEGWPERAMRQCLSQSWTVTVVHDIPTGAMANLERFIDLAGRAGARFHQAFPPALVPLRSGTIALPIEQYVSRIEARGVG